MKQKVLFTSLAALGLASSLVGCGSDGGAKQSLDKLPYQHDQPVKSGDVQFNQFIINTASPVDENRYSLLHSSKPIVAGRGSGSTLLSFNSNKGFEDGGFEDYAPNNTQVYADNLQVNLKDGYLVQNVNDLTKFTYQFPDFIGQTQSLSFSYQSANLSGLSATNGKVDSNITKHLQDLGLAEKKFPVGSYCFNLVERVASIPMFVNQKMGVPIYPNATQQEWKSAKINAYGTVKQEEEIVLNNLPEVDSAKALRLVFEDDNKQPFTQAAIFTKTGNDTTLIGDLEYVAKDKQTFNLNIDPSVGSVKCEYLNDVATDFIEHILLSENITASYDTLPSGQKIAPGELLVDFNDGVTEAQIQEIAQKYGMQLKDNSDYVLFGSGKTVAELQQVKEQIKQEPIVENVEFNRIGSTQRMDSSSQESSSNSVSVSHDTLPSGQQIAHGDLLVSFNDGVTETQMKEIAQKYGMQFQDGSGYSLFSSDKTVAELQQAKSQIEQESLVKDVEYNQIVTTQQAENQQETNSGHDTLPGGEQIAHGDLLVNFNDGVTETQMKEIAQKYGMQFVSHTSFALFSSNKSVAELQQAKAQIEQESLVDAVEYNLIMTISG